MTTKLPFKTQPKQTEYSIIEIGNADTGILEFKKLGYVLAKEDAELSKQLFKQTELTFKAQKLLVLIMKETGLSREDAAEFMNDPSSQPEYAIKYEQHLGELLDAQAAIAIPQYQVTVAMKYRVKNEDGSFGIAGWTLDDTLELPKDLFLEVVAFYQDEVSPRVKDNEEGNEGKSTQQRKNMKTSKG